MYIVKYICVSFALSYTFNFKFYQAFLTCVRAPVLRQALELSEHFNASFKLQWQGHLLVDGYIWTKQKCVVNVWIVICILL